MIEGSREPSSTPPPEQPSDPSAHTQPRQDAGLEPAIDAVERCGPLVVERYRKADGRLLILYRSTVEDG
ncbi:MAG TPA: hypothetical protein VGL57_01565 [Solirubrobacteraceae bacterium]|jgi:hypothetical protein